MQAMKTAIGVLYAGDLGLHLGKLLQEQGHRVLTTVEGRSPRTERRAKEGQFEVLPSLAAVVEQSDVLLSLVPPSAAVALAEQCVAHRKPGATFVDLNSVAPETVKRIGNVFAGSGMNFVDGAVHGMANRLRARGTLYLSGAAAPAVAALFGKLVRIKVLGTEPGQASGFKMMISGLSKGIVALVLEMAVAGRQAGFLDELLACYREAYPGIMALADRLLPTYPEHARRRGEELKEVSATLRSLGIEPCVVEGARCLTERVGRLNLEKGERMWSVPEVIEAVFRSE